MEVVLCRLWEGRFGRRRTTTKTTETSRDDDHEEDIVTRVVIVVHGSPEAPIVGDDRGEGGRGRSFADETITDGAKTTATTERGMRR